MKNKYPGHAGVLAEWATATRIMRAERKPKALPVA
jgi:hypothetical protein